MYHYTFNTLKWGLLQLICDIAPQLHKTSLFNLNQTLFNSNTFLHSQYIQIKPSTTQMYLCTPNTHKWGFLHFICIIAPSNHSNQALFNSNVPFVLPIHTNEVFFTSYVSLHPQIIRIKRSSTQMHLCTHDTLKSAPLTLKCAFGLPIHSHHALFNSNVPLHPQ